MATHWKLFACVLILGVLSVSAEGETKVCKICDDSATTDEKCAKEPDSFTTCTATDKCFTLVTNSGRIKRGCVDDNNKCDSTNLSCVACDAKDTACNTKVSPFFCKTCDSASDPNCAQWTNANDIKSQLCNEGISKCVMLIKDDKNIERRCATSNDEKCPEGKTCEICEASGCNKDVFPTTRRRCYTCSSDNSKCASPAANLNEIKSVPCTLYDAADKCLMIGTSETSMTRGCSSDSVVQKACDDNKDKCRDCSTDSCNSTPFKYSQALKCIQCSSDNADCAWGHEVKEAKNCAKQIEFYQTEGCYTNALADGKTTRGCVHDVDNLNCDTTATCTSCNSADGCNNEDKMDFTCYACRSDLNPACAKPLEGTSFAAEKCRNPVNAETKGCYTEKWNDIYIRSCLVDADVTTRKQCLDPKYTMCDSCLEKNCNSDKLKNAATTAAGAVGGFVLVAAVLALRLF